MANTKEWVFSVRTQLYTTDKKQFLEFELFTDIEKYKFDSMCEFLGEECKVPHMIIPNTDESLTKSEKEKLKFDAQDFDGENFMDIVKNIEQKHFNGKTFQFYVGKDFNAYKKILPFFCKIIDCHQEALKQNKSEKTL